MSRETKMLGAALTILGIVSLLYVIAKGALTGSIGKGGGMTTDAWLALFGWFAIIVGPALWVGETPVQIKQKLKR